jgi:hypothetical protein
MNSRLTKIEKRIRLAGLLVIAGLVVELVSLRWSHPTSFLLFLFMGGSLMAAGVLLFLYGLVSGGESAAPMD